MGPQRFWVDALTVPVRYLICILHQDKLIFQVDDNLIDILTSKLFPEGLINIKNYKLLVHVELTQNWYQ